MESNKPDISMFASLDKLADPQVAEQFVKGGRIEKLERAAQADALVEMSKFNAELPYELRLRIKLKAAELRCSMNQLVVEALQEKYGGGEGRVL